MWVIRVLKGPQAGQTFELKNGANTVGRDVENQIPIQSKGISKVHAKMVVGAEGVTLVDLNSTNGSFVNGVRVKNRTLNSGDKVGFYDVIVHIHRLEAQARPPQNYNNILQFPNSQEQSTAKPLGNPHESPSIGYEPPKNLGDTINTYLENVVLPGIYKFGEMGEFKWVLGIFVLAFIISVTALSLVPMIQITKSSVEKESQRRALTISSHLAERYRRALVEGTSSTFSTQSTDSEEGVQLALIISSKDGSVIAPASKANSADQPFIHRARKSDKKVVEQVSDTLIGAAVPISIYNNDSEIPVPTAHAVILYNMGSLAVDNDLVLGLFFRVLAISLAFGLVLFYFLYKFIEHPIVDLNKKLDTALKDHQDNVSHKYIFPALTLLTENINAALSRSLGGGPSTGHHLQDKSTEAANLLMIMGCAGLACDANGTILSVNPQFEDLTGMRIATLQGQNITILSDQALQLSLKDLLERHLGQPNLISSNSLEMMGRQYELDAQSVQGAKGTDYCIIAIKSRGA